MRKSVFKEAPDLDLSIVIVNFNTCDVLLKCLESIYEKTKGLTFEIIIVDNASHDGAMKMITERYPEIRQIVNAANRGFSTANNQAIRISKGKWVALLNPDTFLIENSFLKIKMYLEEHPEFSILGPGILNESGEQSPTRLWEDTPQDAAWKILGLYNPGIELIRMGELKPKEAMVISGCCFVIIRDLFEEIGFLDENYFLYNEEDDFCRRARKSGKRICFFPETSIKHLLGKSTHQPKHRKKVIWETYKSNLYFYSKHYSSGWNIFLRILYKVTFLLGLIRSVMKHFSGSASENEEDSLRLKLRLIFS